MYDWAPLAAGGAIGYGTWRDALLSITTREAEHVVLGPVNADGTGTGRDMSEGVLYRIMHALEALYPATLIKVREADQQPPPMIPQALSPRLRPAARPPSTSNHLAGLPLHSTGLASPPRSQLSHPLRCGLIHRTARSGGASYHVARAIIISSRSSSALGEASCRALCRRGPRPLPALGTVPRGCRAASGSCLPRQRRPCR